MLHLFHDVLTPVCGVTYPIDPLSGIPQVWNFTIDPFSGSPYVWYLVGYFAIDPLSGIPKVDLLVGYFAIDPLSGTPKVGSFVIYLTRAPSRTDPRALSPEPPSGHLGIVQKRIVINPRDPLRAFRH